MNKTIKNQINAVVTMGLLVAIEVVLTRFLSIRTPAVTIGFGFVPVCLAAMMYGPVRAGIVGALSDFLGAVLFPIGPYFPGFTLTAFIAGVVYGIFFHKKPLKLWHIVAAALVVNLALNLLLNTVWLHILLNKGIWALLPGRLVKVAVMIPVQIVVMQIINKGVGDKLPAPVQPI